MKIKVSYSFCNNSSTTVNQKKFTAKNFFVAGYIDENKMTNYFNCTNNLRIKNINVRYLINFFVDYASDKNLLRQNFNRRKVSMPKFS